MPDLPIVSPLKDVVLFQFPARRETAAPFCNRFYFVDKLLFVTQPHNEGINRMLTKVGLTFERRWYDEPDGLPEPGWFNVFTFTRQMVEAYLAPTREAVTAG